MSKGGGGGGLGRSERKENRKGKKRMRGQDRREERGDGEEDIGSTVRHREEKFKESQKRRYHYTNYNCASLQ